jgi:arylsulfatase A-like enzyme
MMRKPVSVLLFPILPIFAVFQMLMFSGCTGEDRNPNVVIIYTDDQNFENIGVYGGNVLTPNMDRIANEGARFNSFYVSSPVCTPSRYSLITGRYAVRSRVLQENQPTDQPAFIRWNTFLSKKEKTSAHLFKEAGYVTGMVGKYHLGGEFGYLGGDESYDDPAVKDTIAAIYRKWQRNVKEVAGFDYVESLYGNNMHIIGVPKSMQYHNMEWITKGAVDFIDLYKDRPFFLYMAPTLPHVPGPLESLKADPRVTAAGMLDAPITGVQPSRESVFERTRAAGIDDENSPLTWLDDGIGAVLERLEKYGLMENTIIVFASDHQSPRAKMTCYEYGANAPGAIMWKGKIKPHQVLDALVTNVDIVPTILELAGIDPPGDYEMDGKSWVALLNGTKSSIHESLYLEVVYQRAIVTKDWKYIAVRFPDRVNEIITPDNRREFTIEGNRGEDRYHNERYFPGYYDDDQLYYLIDDKGEQHNLASDPAYAGKLAEMKLMMKEYSKNLPFAFGEFK